jgi:hypothetical protein
VRSALDGWGWGLGIHEEGNPLIYSSGYLQYPPNWRSFKIVINNFVEKIRGKKIFPHGAEYEKRFGTPMTHFQNSIKHVVFYGENYSIMVLQVLNSNTISAIFGPLVARGETDLHINDWLDIIHALGNITCECDSESEWWNINEQNNTNKTTYPPAWDTLNELMAGIRKKIKEDTGVEAFEEKLGEEYRKIFGKQITEFERSLNRVYFNDSAKHIHVVRTVNGAAAINEESCWRCLSGNSTELSWCQENCRIAELDISEWLDFVHDLYQIYFKQWEGFESEKEGRRREISAILSIEDNDGRNKEIVFRGCDSYPHQTRTKVSDIDYERLTWRVIFNFSDSKGVEYHGTNTYPLNWGKWIKLMSEMEAKVNTQN